MNISGAFVTVLSVVTVMFTMMSMFSMVIMSVIIMIEMCVVRGWMTIWICCVINWVIVSFRPDVVFFQSFLLLGKLLCHFWFLFLFFSFLFLLFWRCWFFRWSLCLWLGFWWSLDWSWSRSWCWSRSWSRLSLFLWLWSLCRFLCWCFVGSGFMSLWTWFTKACLCFLDPWIIWVWMMSMFMMEFSFPFVRTFPVMFFVHVSLMMPWIIVVTEPMSISMMIEMMWVVLPFKVFWNKTVMNKII